MRITALRRCDGAWSPLPPPAAPRLPPPPRSGVLPPLQECTRLLALLDALPLPEDKGALKARYVLLHQAHLAADTALRAALRRPGGLPGRYGRAAAIDVLRGVGRWFGRLEPLFERIGQGEQAWPRQPVVEGTRTLYENTYKEQPGVAEEARRSMFQERVQRFVTRGGRFEDILVAGGTLPALRDGVHYDYVLDEHGTLRLWPNDVEPKAGHTLLCTGGPEDTGVRAAMAGELWAIRGPDGEIGAVLVANNSGHFKPAFSHLPLMEDVLADLGVPREKIVIFGGPNDVPEMLGWIDGP